MYPHFLRHNVSAEAPPQSQRYNPFSMAASLSPARPRRPFYTGHHFSSLEEQGLLFAIFNASVNEETLHVRMQVVHVTLKAIETSVIHTFGLNQHTTFLYPAPSLAAMKAGNWYKNLSPQASRLLVLNVLGESYLLKEVSKRMPRPSGTPARYRAIRWERWCTAVIFSQKKFIFHTGGRYFCFSELRKLLEDLPLALTSYLPGWASSREKGDLL